MYGLSDTYADVHIKFFLMKFWSSQSLSQSNSWRDCYAQDRIFASI